MYCKATDLAFNHQESKTLFFVEIVLKCVPLNQDIHCTVYCKFKVVKPNQMKTTCKLYSQVYIITTLANNILVKR